MGGCASKPKELGGTAAAAPVENPVPEPEVTEKHVDGVAAQEEVKVETTIEYESKEAPLVDLSSPKSESEKAPVVELAPEVLELKANEPVKVDQAVVTENTPAEAKDASVAEEKEKEKVVAGKAEETKEPAVVADEKTDKISA